MKRLLLVLVIVLAVVSFGETKLRIGVTPVPFVEILEFIRPELEAAGIDLEIVVFSDYVLPNLALASKELDANFFQHAQYLKSFTSQRGIEGLVAAVNVLIAPMGFYMKKPYEELSKGDKIALPNDPTNETRALLLLHNNGVITLKDPGKADITVLDVQENPKGIVLLEMEAGFVPRVFKEDTTVAGAVINTNYALSIGLNSQKDATFVEGKGSPYANFIVVREEDLDSAWLESLAEIITRDEVREFILEKFEGSIVPTF